MADADGLACDMSALPRESRAEHEALARRLLRAAVEMVELADGFAFRFGSAEYDAVTRFVAGERRCCPFLQFTLSVAPDQGPLWVRMTGPEGAKAVLRAELHLPHADSVG
jgi:hypothetical protein